jgi:hypothetical protein
LTNIFNSDPNAVFLIDAVIQRIYELKDFPGKQFGKVFCKFLYGSDAFAQSASSLLLAAIAWDRTLLLFFPQKRTTLSSAVLIAFSCLLALCAAYPRISHYKLAGVDQRVFNGSHVVNVTRTRCFPLIVHPETGEVCTTNRHGVLIGFYRLLMTPLKQLVLHFGAQ